MIVLSLLLLVHAAAAVDCTAGGLSCRDAFVLQFCDENLKLLTSRNCTHGCDAASRLCKQTVAEALGTAVTAPEYLVTQEEQCVSSLLFRLGVTRSSSLSLNRLCCRIFACRPDVAKIESALTEIGGHTGDAAFTGFDFAGSVPADRAYSPVHSLPRSFRLLLCCLSSLVTWRRDSRRSFSASVCKRCLILCLSCADLMTSIHLRLLASTSEASAAGVNCIARDVQFKSAGRHTTADRALPKQALPNGTWSWMGMLCVFRPI